MNVFQFLRLTREPTVELRVIPWLSRDLRDPRDAHKLARKLECRKVVAAPPFTAPVCPLFRRQDNFDHRQTLEY